MYHLLTWNQGLEFTKHVLDVSRNRHKMCSTFMEESSLLHEEVSMLTTDMEYMYNNMA